MYRVRLANKEATEPRVPLGYVEVITWKVLRSPSWPLWNICVTNDDGYVPLVVHTLWSFIHSWLITRFVTRLTRRVPLVEQELLTPPKHLRSPPVFSGVRVTRSLVLSVCFVDRCFTCCTFSFGHWVVCFSSIYGFWLPLWYPQTLLINFTIFSVISWQPNLIGYGKQQALKYRINWNIYILHMQILLRFVRPLMEISLLFLFRSAKNIKKIISMHA
jgi:hypothetical protein